jgi:hypothetical protein
MVKTDNFSKGLKECYIQSLPNGEKVQVYEVSLTSGEAPAPSKTLPIPLDILAGARPRVIIPTGPILSWF